MDYCSLVAGTYDTATHTETWTSTPTWTPTNTATPTITKTFTKTLTPAPTAFCPDGSVPDITSSINTAAVTGTTSGGTNDFNNFGIGGSSPDRVFRFTLTEPRRVTLSLCGSAFDTYLYLRTVCDDQTTTVAANDDSTVCGVGSKQSQITNVTLDTGTYYVIVDGYGSTVDSGLFSLSISAIQTSCPGQASAGMTVTGWQLCFHGGVGGYANGYRMSLDQDSNLSALSVFNNYSNTAYMRLAVYSNVGNSPHRLIVQSMPITTSGTGWTTVPVPTTLLYAGQYWLMACTEMNNPNYPCLLGRSSTSNGGYAYVGASLPATITGWSNMGNYDLSIYANLCGVSPGAYITATPTNTLTPTFTYTPSFTVTPTPTVTLTPTVTFTAISTCEQPGVIGQTTPAGSFGFSLDSSYMLYDDLVLTKACYLTALNINMASTSGSARVFLFTSRYDGRPERYLVSSLFTTAVGWNYVPMNSPLLYPGKYWVGITSSNSRDHYLGPQTGEPVYLQASVGWDPIIENPNPQFVNWNRDLQLTAELCQLEPGTYPSPTMTPTISPTPTYTHTPTHTPTVTWTTTPTLTPVLPASCADSPLEDLTARINSSPFVGNTSTSANDYARGAYGAEAPDDLYSFTLATPRAVTVSLCGSSFDTVLYLRSQCGNDSSTIAFNDDAAACGGTGKQSRIAQFLDAGTYYVIVDGYQLASDAGQYILSITASP